MKKFNKIIKFINIGLLVFSLLIPLALFLNRFLIPDVSYDSLNYHLFLGQRGIDKQNIPYEFYPTGMHNFSPILEVPGYLATKLFGYRVGSIASLIFLYLSIFILYKIFKLYEPKIELLDKWWLTFFFVSSFLSFEAFLQIATFYVDIDVAFLSLLSFYFLLKYEKKSYFIDLVFSAVFLGILFLGKLTGAYYLVTYFIYLAYVLVNDSKIDWRQRIVKFLLSGLIVISFSLPFWYKNYLNTKNPVYPYYNNIFKSNLYPTKYFTQDKSGPDNTFEKLFWGVVSIKKPEKLGQVHDLFHDYKINIYFILIIFVLIWSLIKKDRDLIKLSIFYFATYEIWAWVFGYLRYAVFLEFMGGIILLIWLSRLKGWTKYLIIGPLFFIMLLQGKRIVNLSLAYDISFRPGYFYNRLSYPKQWEYFGNKKISVDEKYLNEFQPQVFLNCASPNMSYYTLSDFNKLPVLNIDRRAYSEMTGNKLFVDIQKEWLSKIVKGNTVKFVTIAAETGLNNFYLDCKANIISRGYTILTEVDSNFLGYEGQRLKVIFGEFNW